MTTYTAELPNSLLYDSGAIDALLGLGCIRLIYEVDVPSRAQAVRELGDEFDWRNMDRDFWDKRLSGKRGTR